MRHPVESELGKLREKLNLSRVNLQASSDILHRLTTSGQDSRFIFMDCAVKLAKLGGTQQFLENALAQQEGQVAFDEGNELRDEFGFISWAIAGGALATLGLGSWIYHQYTETKQFGDRMTCYEKMRNSGMSASEAAKVCFGSGVLGMLGLDAKTLGLVGGALILAYWVLKRI